MTTKSLIPILVTAVMAVSCKQAPREANAQEAKTVTKFGVKVTAGPMDSVLLKGYAPKPTLAVPETRLEKARYPVIDVHTHTTMNRIQSAADVAE